MLFILSFLSEKEGTTLHRSEIQRLRKIPNQRNSFQYFLVINEKVVCILNLNPSRFEKKCLSNEREKVVSKYGSTEDVPTKGGSYVKPLMGLREHLFGVPRSFVPDFSGSTAIITCFYVKMCIDPLFDGEGERIGKNNKLLRKC